MSLTHSSHNSDSETLTSEELTAKFYEFARANDPELWEAFDKIILELSATGDSLPNIGPPATQAQGSHYIAQMQLGSPTLPSFPVQMYNDHDVAVSSREARAVHLGEDGLRDNTWNETVPLTQKYRKLLQAAMLEAHITSGGDRGSLSTTSNFNEIFSSLDPSIGKTDLHEQWGEP